MNPEHVALEQFKAAAAEGAHFELEARMLGGTTPSTAALKIDVNLSELLGKLIVAHGDELDADEKGLLIEAARIRNKILHCEFSSARDKLNRLDPKTRGGKVAIVKLGTGTGATLVAETKTSTLDMVFFWLLESTTAGEFVEAANIFKKATSLLIRLLDVQANKE